MKKYSTELILITIFHLSFLFSSHLFGQDYDWWVKKHNWDGNTSWTRYIRLNTKYLGPNALPVPEIKTGQIQSQLNLGLFVETHQSKGDQTYNQFTNLYIPLGNRVGLEWSLVPLEYYQMDTITRDQRFARDKDAKGFSGGDIYIGTHIQLIKETETKPGMLASINLRSASGTNLQAARFTDTPGYFMDVSLGKNFKVSKLFTHRWFAQVGFYSWQTYDPEHAQNDAFQYGLGYSVSNQKMELRGSWGGYIGYINDGDRPMLARLQFKTKKLSGINYLAQVQQGLVQFNYTSLRIGISWLVPINLKLD